MKAHKKYMRSTFFIMVLLNLFSFSFFPQSVGSINKQQSDTSKANFLYKVGLKAYNNNKYDSAVFYLNQAIDLNQNNYLYYGYKGSAERILGNYSEALIVLNKALELNKMNAGLFYERGLTKQALKKFSEAVYDYNAAINLSPKSYDVIYSRAINYRFLNRIEDALKDINFLISKEPDNPALYYERGLENIAKQNYRESASDLSKYLVSKPKENLLASYYNRGVSYVFLGNFDNAVNDLEKAVNMQPEAIAYNFLGIAYAGKTDSVNAIKSFKKSLELNAKSSDTYFEYGKAKYEFGDCETGLDLVNKAFELLDDNNPLRPNYYHIRASIKACLHDTVGALKDFDTSIKLDSNNYKAYIRRITFLHSDLKYAKLIKDDISKLIKVYPFKNDLPFLNAMEGLYLVYAGDTAKAEYFYKRAIELAPGKAYAYYNLAAYYVFFTDRQKNRDKIVESLKQSIAIEKTFFESYKLLALVYSNIDNDDKSACKVLKEAETQLGDTKEIKQLKDVYCKGKEGDGDLRLEMFTVPNGETELFSILFGQQIESKPIKAIDSKTHLK